MPVPRRFSRIGGDPALDFLNTQPMGPEGLDERLVDLAALVAWCRTMQLITPSEARRLGGSADGRSTLAAVRELREAFRAAIQAQHARRPEWGRLVPMLNAGLRRCPGIQILRMTKGGAALETTRALKSASDLPGVIAGAIARFISGPELGLARRCRDSACVLWFVDRTRNHSRQWCRMESCGARAKSRAYYRRRKQERSHRTPLRNP